VEKVRLFIGQGLLQLLSAIVLLSGTLIIIFSTNARLAWVAMPILPIALVLFMIFGAISAPLFAQVQARLSALNTILQENLAGIRVIKAFTREPEEEAKFAANEAVLTNKFVARIFTFLFPLVFLVANWASQHLILRRPTDHRRHFTLGSGRSSACTWCTCSSRWRSSASSSPSSGRRRPPPGASSRFLTPRAM
jgi:hypothetical protein